MHHHRVGLSAANQKSYEKVFLFSKIKQVNIHISCWPAICWLDNCHANTHT